MLQPMRTRGWWFGVLLAGLISNGLPGTVGAFQIPPESPPEEGAEPELEGGLSRRELTRRLGSASRTLKEQRYAEGVALLQKILDNPRDEYCVLPELGPGETSVKRAAERLLSELPPEGLDAYEAQYGPMAQKLLDDLTARFEPLDPVIDRFLLTSAGRDALYRMGVRAWEVGRPRQAAACFELLKEQPGAIRPKDPTLSLQLAAALFSCGEETRAAAVLDTLRERHPEATWNLASVPAGPRAGQGTEWLRGVVSRARTPQETHRPGWLNVRGDAQHNLVGAGGGPYLNHGWRIDTLADYEANSLEGRLRDIHADLQQQVRPESETAPQVSLASPLVIADLVVVRTLLDLRAFDRVTGALVWRTTERDRELLDLLRPGGLPQSNQTQGTPAEQLVAQRHWLDGNFQGITSDGERVFAVEDLGLANLMLPSRTGPNQLPANRLLAHDARSGRLLWESGGTRDTSRDPLAGTFFLGAPLAWQGLLYALVDLGSTPHLAILEPEDGQLRSLQPLGGDEPELGGLERSRHHLGLTPSVAAGILLCPTGPDFVTAFDPIRWRLLWRFRFRPRTEAPGPRQQMIILQQQMARQASRVPEQSGWLDFGGVVHGDRVLFTPRDNDEVYCLNAATGQLLWKSPRGGALFLGGVLDDRVVLVGRNFLQTLHLADGTPAWNAPTLLAPVSGRGCLVDRSYLVPLVTGEVVSVDVADGRVLSRARSFTGQVPGSLVLAGGTVVTQRLETTAAYRQVEALQAEVTSRLEQDPDHAESLTVRGQMRMERGDFDGALADLERAVTLMPKNAEARGLLLSALLEGLRTDFERYHAFGPRAETLVESPAERARLHWLLALGYERMQRGADALGQLLAYARLDLGDFPLERVGTSLLIRRDRQLTLAAERLVTNAEPPQREDLKELLQAAARESLETPDRARGLRFWELFGALVPDPARLLAERAQVLRGDEWLWTELVLARVLATSRGTGVGTLWSEWGELLLRAERPRDVGPFIAQLQERQRRGDPDLQPALDRSAEWQGREEVRRVAERRHPWPTGEVTVERMPGPRPVAIGRTQPLAIDGPRGPYLTDVTLELGTGDQQLVARGSDGRPLWKLALQTPLWAGNAQFNRAWVRDHLLVLLVGKDLLAVDLLGTPEDPGPRWLWHQNLIEASAAIMVQRGLAPAQARLNFAPLGPDNTAVVGPISQQQIVVLRGRRLSALDSFTGLPIWTREGITPGSGLLGDDQELLVVPPETLEAQVYGARDGAARGSVRMPPSSWWLTPRGRNLVVWGRPLDRQVLALRNLASGEDVWSREFPAGSLVAQVEGHEALVLEGTGHLTCVDLERGEVRFETDIDPGESVHEMQVVRTGEHYLVMANRPLPNGPTIVRHSQNVHLTVNGTVHLLDRAAGKWLWSAVMERQQFDPQQPAGLPLVTFASHVFEPRRGGNGLEQRFLMTSLDRRTGKLLYEESRSDEPLHFIDYRIDEDAQTIELQLFQSVVKFTFSEK